MSVISTMSPRLRAAVGAGVLLTCWLAGTCTRQTPGSPSSGQTQANQSAENTPPKPTTAPAAVEDKRAEAASSQPGQPSGAQAANAPSAAQPENAPPPAPPLVLPAGTVLTVRTSTELSATSSPAGTAFQAVVAQPVMSRGRTAIPAGVTVTGVVVQAKQGGKIKGASNLALRLTSLNLRDATYSIHTNQFVQQQKGKGKRTAKIGVGGAAGGAVIGGIAGGGKGAAIGSLLGGGAGVAGSAMTGNKELKIPAESVLSFKLTRSLQMNKPVAPGSGKETQR